MLKGDVLIEQLSEPVLVMDAKGSVVHSNRAFRELAERCGVPARLVELFGPPANVLVSEGRRNGSATAFLPLVVGDDPSRGYRLGVRSCVEHPYCVVQLTDLSEEIAWRRQLFDRNTELAVINEIGSAVAATLEPGEMVRRLWELTGRVMDAEHFVFATQEPESRRLEFLLWVERGEVVPVPEPAPWRALTAYVLASGEPLLLNGDVAERHQALGLGALPAPCASFAAVPIVADDQALGVIALSDPETTGRFGRHQLGVLMVVASQAAVALRNAHLFAGLKRAYEELSQTQKRLLEAERLRGVTETVGALNHEVNNPLATVIGTTQLMLQRSAALDPATCRRLQRVLESAKRIQFVTGRMATLIQTHSRPYPGVSAILDVRALLAEIPGRTAGEGPAEDLRAT